MENMQSNHKPQPLVNRLRNDELQPAQDLVDYAKAYAKERPEVIAMWCFGVGFIVGWKLKPW